MSVSLIWDKYPNIFSAVIVRLTELEGLSNNSQNKKDKKRLLEEMAILREELASLNNRLVKRR